MIMTHIKSARGANRALPGTMDVMPEEGEYEVRCSRDQAALAEMIESNQADFVLVGAVLPARSGRELCRLLGSEEGQMHYPVVLLKHKGDSSTAVRDGAESRRLAGRMPEASADKEHAMKDLTIHLGRHEVRVQGEVVDLTATEFRLLLVFTEKPGWVFSRDQIIESIRGKGYACTPRSVDVLIVSLRRKLGALSKRIQTVRGVGYRYRE